MRTSRARVLRTLLATCATALSGPAVAVTFTDVTQSAGLDYLQYQVTAPPFVGEPEYMTGAAAASDYDGDGWVDLYVTRLDATDLLFRNRGDGGFEEVSQQAGLSLALRSNGAAWGDVDNDGDPDLYVTTLGANERRHYLFVNDGAGGFDEEAVARGAAVETDFQHFGYSATFGDYDLDGWLDLHTSEWRLPAEAETHVRLLRNRGAAQPGHFDDVTTAAGVSVEETRGAGVRSYAFASRFADMDDDGFPDLLIAADFGTSRLFWNDGDGTFTEGAAAAGVGTDENGMGSAVADWDGDGRLDWFVTSIFDPEDSCAGGGCNWGASGNRLYRNEGGRSFSDQTDAAGVRDGYWGWGAAFLDFDNDGDLDLAMTNGIDFPFVPAPQSEIWSRFSDDPMRLWESDGVGGMTETSATAGLTDTGRGKGLLTFDYDRDGDLDLFVVNNAGHPRLYRNDGGNANGWLRVRVRGTESNRDGLGARVRVVTTSGVQLREVNAGSHFLGQSETVAHFGLGPGGDAVPVVRVDWPATGRRRVYLDVPRNTTLDAVEPGPPSCGLSGLEALTLPALLAGLRRRRSTRKPREKTGASATGAEISPRA